MQQVRDKILIYEWRTLSQRIEAVFDFLRLCRRAWFLLAAALFAPVCVVLTSSAFFNYQAGEASTSPFEWMTGFFSWTSGPGAAFFICVASVGVWAVFIHVYSLLAAYEDNDFCLDDATLRQLWPYVRATVLPSLIPASLLIIILLLLFSGRSIVFGVLLCVLAVPLSLFPPVYMIERKGSVHALGKAIRMGFSSWFTLALAIVMVMLFGAVMLLSFNMPWLLAQMFDAISSSGEEWWYVMFFRFVSIVLTIVAYLSCYMVGAMVQLYCVYHYGNMAHLNGDDSSYGDTINHFENL